VLDPKGFERLFVNRFPRPLFPSWLRRGGCGSGLFTEFMKVADLPNKWRADAASLRRYAASVHADIVEHLAAELQAVIREETAEELTLKSAASESGLTYSAIQKMVANGVLENLGSKGDPRVRRGDLPKKVAAHRRGIASEVLVKKAG
jgi:hypothetical protein